MKLQYHFVILLGLGFFLPAHGMDRLLGSGEKKKDIQEKEEKISFKEDVKTWSASDNFKSFMEKINARASVEGYLYLAKNNKAIVIERLGKSGVLILKDLAYNQMMKRMENICYAFQEENVESNEQQISIMGELENELKNKARDEQAKLIEGVSRHMTHTIQQFKNNEDNKARVIERLKKGELAIFAPLVPMIFNKAMDNLSDWQEDICKMAQNSLYPKED